LSVSNEPWIEQQLLNAFFGISRYFVGIELAESAAIAFSLVQDRRPVQSGLRPFQNKKLELLSSWTGTPHSSMTPSVSHGGNSALHDIPRKFSGF